MRDSRHGIEEFILFFSQLKEKNMNYIFMVKEIIQILTAVRF